MHGSLFPVFERDILTYQEGFLSPHEADRHLQQLWSELNWSQRPIRLFGRVVMQPRLLAWYGDPEAVYRYSGITLQPEPWHEILLAMRKRLVALLDIPFNAVLANAYRDGQDSMGWHADDERELGPDPTVASISLGAERRFMLRNKESRQSAAMALGHGSLLVMKGRCQRLYQHSLPKTRREVGLRINLTYRCVRGCVSEAGQHHAH